MAQQLPLGAWEGLAQAVGPHKSLTAVGVLHLPSPKPPPSACKGPTCLSCPGAAVYSASCMMQAALGRAWTHAGTTAAHVGIMHVSTFVCQ